MLLFCNYLEAHIMMCYIMLLRVFLSCYKRILLSHQSTSILIHTVHTLPTIPIHTLPTIPHKVWAHHQKFFSGRKGKEVWAHSHRRKKNKKKTQGMRRNLPHLYGVFIHHLPHANPTTPPASAAIFLGGRKLEDYGDSESNSTKFASKTSTSISPS